ncbi:hypothetical protein [Subtercola sp. YIM 133946]|uniref:hypothetical protein n=1 Tax=Subtercola sp. YIM 133946 TaxID=3118909 RepID=UPI002F94145B
MFDDLHPEGDPFIGEKFRSTDKRDIEPRVLFVHSLATSEGYPFPGHYSVEMLEAPDYRATPAGRPYEDRRRTFSESTLRNHWEKVSH